MVECHTHFEQAKGVKICQRWINSCFVHCTYVTFIHTTILRVIFQCASLVNTTRVEHAQTVSLERTRLRLVMNKASVRTVQDRDNSKQWKNQFF